MMVSPHLTRVARWSSSGGISRSAQSSVVGVSLREPSLRHAKGSPSPLLVSSLRCPSSTLATLAPLYIFRHFSSPRWPRWPKSSCRLKLRCPSSSSLRTASRICTFEQSASAAKSRGTMVSAASSSADRMITEPTGDWPSPHGHALPPAYSSSEPGQYHALVQSAFASNKHTLPRGNRCSHSQSTFSGLISAAHLTTRRESVEKRFCVSSRSQRACSASLPIVLMGQPSPRLPYTRQGKPD